MLAFSINMQSILIIDHFNRIKLSKTCSLSIGHGCPRLVPWVEWRLVLVCVRLLWSIKADFVSYNNTGETTEGPWRLKRLTYIDIWPSDKVLASDTLSCHDNHLCHIIFKSHHAIQSYGLDTKRFHHSLSTKFKCKLWSWPLTYQHGSCTWNIILSCLSFVPNLCQISFKSHHAIQSYVPDTK